MRRRAERGRLAAAPSREMIASVTYCKHELRRWEAVLARVLLVLIAAMALTCAVLTLLHVL